jgi:glycosyltransferase involved in cell wall biosynthesis
MKIVHVFRAPIGGLFRHVRDLARGQTELGHEVGIVCDSTTGGDYAAQLLAELKPHCSLGIERRPISRMPGIGDLAGTLAVMDIARKWNPDVLHGHGAKGGVYARLAAYRLKQKSFYTPHGGSLHHPASWPMQLIYDGTEKMLRRIGTGLCFVCNYERDRFDRMIGINGSSHIVVHNGLWEDEFIPATADPDATDFLFIGEMRDYKGVDILLDAIARIKGATLTLVGDGPSIDDYKSQAEKLGIAKQTYFLGRLSMTEAVKRGRIMVLPSRFESFPYVVLETAAASLPLITTDVGGIAEVVPRSLLCEPLTSENLAARMSDLLADPGKTKRDGRDYAALIRRTCSAPEMSRKITDFYTTA